MHYILEAFIVGIYTSLIYIIVSHILKINNLWLLLVVGFCKHFFGYYLKIHTWYCNNGYSCNTNLLKYTAKSNILTLIFYSFGEALMFVMIGTILNFFKLTNKNHLQLFFIIGFAMHVLAEILGIHKWFCETECV